MSITVVPVPKKSVHFPTIKATQPVEVTERDPPGFLVALIEATDADNDTLWYDIVGKCFSVWLCSMFLTFLEKHIFKIYLNSETIRQLYRHAVTLSGTNLKL